jgi:hypothetical protein
VKRVLAAAFVWLVLPGAAHAGDATIVARDLLVGPIRSLAALRPTPTFDLVGLHWQGTGTVSFRTRSLRGRWSAWRPADVDDHVAGGRGWRLGEPYWTGPSDRLAYRVNGSVQRLRAYYVWSPVEAIPYRTESIAGSPQIVPRVGWGADESLRRKAPRYAPSVHFAVVHHTAGTNSYTPAQSAAIVRGIALYHVRGNGWNDIGYNFLVDRYGQIFEGRYGGIAHNVIGAHAEGFNTGSTGVAVIGNFSAHAPPPAARRALVKLLAWRLDVAHDDPLSMLTWSSGGNPRFPTGSPVFLRTISGHRDTGFTDCPGTALYRLLDSIATQVATTGLPKLYSPLVQGKLGGPIRFTARLSSSLPWTVTVTSGGETIAQGTGTGTTVSWTWDSSVTSPGGYAWTIDAGPTVRPATGTIGAPTVIPPPPSGLLTDLAVSPTTVSPNGDGFADTATVTYALHARAAVTAVVQDENGTVVRTLFTSQRQSARQIGFPFVADDLPDGRYTLDVAAIADDGSGAGADATFLVDRTLSGVAVSPTPFTPGSGPITLSFSLAKPAQVTVVVFQNGQPLATLFSGPLDAGQQAVGWDGQLASGPAPPGHYDVGVTAADDVGETSQTAGFDVASAGG